MIKLPATLRRDTASKLEAARTDLEAAERKLAELNSQRTAALSADDDEVIAPIDDAIVRQHRVIAVKRDRLPILEAKLVAEQRIEREREHREAIDRFEVTLAPLAAASDKLEQAILAVAVAAREFDRAADIAQRTWPPGVTAWAASHLEGGRAGDLLRECFSPGGLWRRLGERVVAGPDASEYFAKAISADERAAGFAQLEREHHKTLMADLRAQPVLHPELVPIDDIDQSAAA